jgi:thiol:disulfide interchange protein
VNVDNPANRGMVNEYGASSIPLLIVFNDQGEITHRFMGLTSDAALRDAFEEALDASAAPSEGETDAEQA